MSSRYLNKVEIPSLKGEFQLQMHDGARILSFSSKLGKSYVHIINDVERPTIVKNFLLLGNEDKVPLIDLSYIGSVRNSAPAGRGSKDKFEEDLHLFELIFPHSRASGTNQATSKA